MYQRLKATNTLGIIIQASHYKLAVLGLNSLSGWRCDFKTYRHLWLGCRFQVQEVDAGPPESKINDLPCVLSVPKYIYTKQLTYNTSPMAIVYWWPRGINEQKTPNSHFLFDYTNHLFINHYNTLRYIYNSFCNLKICPF